MLSDRHTGDRDGLMRWLLLILDLVCQFSMIPRAGHPINRTSVSRRDVSSYYEVRGDLPQHRPATLKRKTTGITPLIRIIAVFHPYSGGCDGGGAAARCRDQTGGAHRGHAGSA